PQDQNPAEAEDANEHCRALRGGPERFRWNRQSGCATGICRAGKEKALAGARRWLLFRVWIAGSWIGETSIYDPEGARPAGFIEEVKQGVYQGPHPVAGPAPLILILWRYERPVDEHRTANKVFPRNEAIE